MNDVTNEQLLIDFTNVAAQLRTIQYIRANLLYDVETVGEKSTKQIEKSEKLRSLYAEYTSLRAEILKRMEKGRVE